MKIWVSLRGGLRRPGQAMPLEVEVERAATVADVVQGLDLRPGEVWLAMLGQRVVGADHPLRPGDELSLLPPVGGGG